MSACTRRSEFEIIAEVLAPLALGADLAFGLRDDAALVEPRPGECLVTTADALVAGVHFPRDEAADLVARKALRVNLSDLAAMGADPVAYFMTVALPPEIDDSWIELFAEGLARDQTEFALALAGGDIVATSSELVLSITALGSVAREAAIRRNGARPGDRIFVSGTIGDAALGLLAMKGEIAGPGAGDLIGRYRLPRPRLALGRALRGSAHAAIDVSDGLVADLMHVCESSSVAAEIRGDAVPLSDAGRAALARAPELMSTVLTGGDDYELLFTAPAALDPAASDGEVAITEIGEIVEGRGVAVVGADGAPLALDRGGFSHR